MEKRITSPETDKCLGSIADSGHTFSSLDDFKNANLLLDQDGKISVFFAPHNLIVNPDCKILIVGICPGLGQSIKAVNTFHQTGSLLEAKLQARFVGQTRKNLKEMLDGLHFAKICGMANAQECLDDIQSGLDTIALIPFPVFVNGKNYSGSSPKIAKNKLLSDLVDRYFIPLIQDMKHLQLLIPLGKAVEEELLLLENQKKIPDIPVLFGFPHPSGLNARRSVQYKTHYESMRDILEHTFDCAFDQDK